MVILNKKNSTIAVSLTTVLICYYSVSYVTHVQGFVPFYDYSSTSSVRSTALGSLEGVQDTRSDNFLTVKNSYPTTDATWTPQKKTTASKTPPFFAERVDTFSKSNTSSWSPSKVATRKSFTMQQPSTPMSTLQSKVPANLSPQQEYFATRIQESRQRALMASLQSNKRKGALQVLGRAKLEAKPKPKPKAAPLTPLDPELLARQQYFAKRIQLSRQRTLLDSIAGSKGQTTTTIARLDQQKNKQPSLSTATKNTKPYITNNVGVERQQVLLQDIAKSAGTTATTGSLFARMPVDQRPIVRNEPLTESQQYFAKRIEFSRQRALLTSIETSRGQTTTATLGNNTAAEHDANLIDNKPVSMDAESVKNRRAYFLQRIAESRRTANERVQAHAVTTKTTTATIPSAVMPETPSASTVAAPAKTPFSPAGAKPKFMPSAATVTPPNDQPSKFTPPRPKTMPTPPRDVKQARLELEEALKDLEIQSAQSDKEAIKVADETVQQAKLELERTLQEMEHSLASVLQKTKYNFVAPTKKEPLSTPFKAAAAAAEKASTTNPETPFTANNGPKPWAPSSTKSVEGPVVMPKFATKPFPLPKGLNNGPMPWSPSKPTAPAARATKPFASPKGFANGSKPWSPSKSSAPAAKALKPLSPLENVKEMFSDGTPKPWSGNKAPRLQNEAATFDSFDP